MQQKLPEKVNEIISEYLKLINEYIPNTLEGLKKRCYKLYELYDKRM